MWTTSHQREVSNYGGLPYDYLLAKMEATDDALMVAGGDEFADETPYRDQVRREVVDWGPDTPFLEEDGVRRDPSLSKMRLNMLHNGNRGSTYDMPSHPDLFVGFTGNDPRGAGNDPRLEQFRTHLSHRGDIFARVGGSDSLIGGVDFVQERPWTNQAIAAAKQEVFRRTRADARIFSTQREGKRLGGTVVAADGRAAGKLRAEVGEAAAIDFARRAAASADDRVGDAFVGAGRGDADPAASAARGNASGRFDDGRTGSRWGSAGRAASVSTGAAAGGGRARGTEAAGQFGGDRTAAARRLGVVMAAAARADPVADGVRGTAPGDTGSWAAGGGYAPAEAAVAAAALARADGIRADAPGGAGDGVWGTGSGLAPHGDARRAAGRGGADGVRTDAPGSAGDGGWGASGRAAPADVGRAARGTVAAAAPRPLADVAAVVGAGVREGSAASMRRVAGAVEAALAAPAAAGALGGGARGSGAPTGDSVRNSFARDRGAAPQAAGAGLTTHVYGGGAPRLSPGDAAAGQVGMSATAWQESRSGFGPAGLGVPEARSAARGYVAPDGELGGASDGVAGGASGGAGTATAVGPKRLRPVERGDASLADGGDFGGDFA